MNLASRRRTRALAIAVAIGAAGCAHAPSSPTPIPIRTAAVAARAVAAPLELAGSVVATRSARVGAVVAGRIVEMRVRVGDRVVAGQPLAAIDDATYRAQLAQATAGAAGASAGGSAAAAGVAQADARLGLARVTQHRMAQLYSAGAISRQQYDQTQADFEGARAAQAQARAQRDAAADAAAQSGAAAAAAAIAVEDSVIRAPFDGVVTERLADVGTAVGAGTPVAAIQDDRSLEVVVAVPQAQAATLHRGMRVGVRADDLDATLSGTIAGLAPADPALRSVLARIALPSARGLQPGTFVRVSLPGTARRGETVPLDALVTRGGQTGVFVVARGIAHFAPVRAGSADMRDVEVTGLRPSDRTVAVTNLEGLTDGVTVTVDP